MPELPEVETIARSLAARVRGKTLVAVEKFDWERLVEHHPPYAFCTALIGQQITAVGRRGKWLLFSLTPSSAQIAPPQRPDTLAFHLRMSGSIMVCDTDQRGDPHTHLIIALDDGSNLVFRDPRKFGRVRLLTAHELAMLSAALGPEPLDDTFRVEDLARRLERRHARIKSLLLDQRVIAGLGNIYVDETLWLAGIHPLRPANSLTYEEISHLHWAIREVLHQAITNAGSTLRDYRDSQGYPGRHQHDFSVYGRTGLSCMRCGSPIVRIVVAQRGTHICSVCQPLHLASAIPSPDQ